MEISIWDMVLLRVWSLTPDLSFSGGQSSSVPSHVQRNICLRCTVAGAGAERIWVYFYLIFSLHSHSLKARPPFSCGCMDGHLVPDGEELSCPLPWNPGRENRALLNPPAQGRPSPWSAAQFYHMSLLYFQNRTQWWLRGSCVDGQVSQQEKACGNRAEPRVSTPVSGEMKE